MRLFADRGFRATTVGDIEAAVGLQPRRGALYKHFPSKQALLEAAVSADVDRAVAGARQITEPDRVVALGTGTELVRPAIHALGRWFLDEMDRLKNLTRLLEHDGDRLRGSTAEVKIHIVDLSYRTAASLIAAIAPEVQDPEATALLVLGPLVALRRTTWTFGTPPLGIDDDRVLTAWTDLTVAFLNSDVLTRSS
jgi:AcrR family transcriptional regulator